MFDRLIKSSSVCFWTKDLILVIVVSVKVLEIAKRIWSYWGFGEFRVKYRRIFKRVEAVIVVILREVSELLIILISD